MSNFCIFHYFYFLFFGKWKFDDILKKYVKTEGIVGISVKNPSEITYSRSRLNKLVTIFWPVLLSTLRSISVRIAVSISLDPNCELEEDLFQDSSFIGLVGTGYHETVIHISVLSSLGYTRHRQIPAMYLNTTVTVGFPSRIFDSSNQVKYSSPFWKIHNYKDFVFFQIYRLPERCWQIDVDHHLNRDKETDTV